MSLMKQAVEITTSIKSSPLSTGLSGVICDRMGSTHEALCSWESAEQSV